MRPGLSVSITTCNNETTLDAALSSVRFADEIVVVDSGSTDGTLAIAERCNSRIIRQSFLGYGAQKNFAMDACSHEWVLSLDSDEAVTAELAGEIRQVVCGERTGFEVYSMPRLSRFIDRWMRHGGWYPDRVVRLFRKGTGRFTDHPIHDRFQAQHPVGRLSGDILHYTYDSISDYVQRQNRYTSLTAAGTLAEGRHTRITAPGLAWDLLRKFLEVYVLKRGFLDGRYGFVVSCLAAYGVFLRQTKVWKPEQTGAVAGNNTPGSQSAFRDEGNQNP